MLYKITILIVATFTLLIHIHIGSSTVKSSTISSPDPVFSTWKSARVLEKASIKIMARAIYTYWFFPYTYTVFFCWKIKSCHDRCFAQQIGPQTIVQLISVIGFKIINKRHILSIVYTMLVKIRQVSIIVLLRVKWSMW